MKINALQATESVQSKVIKVIARETANGPAFVGFKRIADELELSRSTVRHAVYALRRRGIIIIENNTLCISQEYEVPSKE